MNQALRRALIRLGIFEDPERPVPLWARLGTIVVTVVVVTLLAKALDLFG